MTTPRKSNRHYHSIHSMSITACSIFGLFTQFTPYNFRNEETCLAKSADDGRWYRAYSQGKIDDNTYNLLYLDYGNMEAVPIDRIREMREEFFFPSITLHCFIDGKTTNILGKRNMKNSFNVLIIS